MDAALAWEALATAQIFKLIKLAILRVILERLVWIKHLLQIWLLSQVEIGLWLWSWFYPLLRNVLFNKTFPFIENLAWVYLLNLSFVLWDPDCGFERGGLLDYVIDNSLGIDLIDQIILVFVLNCEFLATSRFEVDPSQPWLVVFLVCIVQVYPLSLLSVDEGIAQEELLTFEKFVLLCQVLPSNCHWCLRTYTKSVLVLS